MLRRMNQRSLAISNPGHLVTLQLEPFLQKKAKRRIIFNNQNSHLYLPKQKNQYRKSHYLFGCV